MGMFDDYHPGVVICPFDGEPINDAWQGKDGPCLLSAYHQGNEYPELPNVFELYASHWLDETSGSYHWVDAIGIKDNDGIWTETIVVNVSADGMSSKSIWNIADGTGVIYRPRGSSLKN